MCVCVHVCLERECNDTDIRLVGGESAMDGSVQICNSGLWVSVCDETWDFREAEMVCSHLGHSGSKCDQY